jgi:uncharacterized membrane protein YkvA (DUF1232 family)
VSILQALRDKARALKRETLALVIAARDPRTPWYARALALAIVAYAASPIDLIPDFIPVLGYLDDLVLVPLGIVLVLKMIPPEVMAEARVRAAAALEVPGGGLAAAAVIAALWLLAAVLGGIWLLRLAG